MFGECGGRDNCSGGPLTDQTQPEALTLALKGYDAEQGAPTAAADDAPLSATTEARLNALEARLNALEAAARPRQPRFAPDVQALQDRLDADLEARRTA